MGLYYFIGFSSPAYQFLFFCAWILQRALALEDALSKGLPIEKEIASLQANLGDIDKDSVLDLVLASLPEETRSNGTDTQLQLKQKVRRLLLTLHGVLDYLFYIK